MDYLAHQLARIDAARMEEADAHERIRHHLAESRIIRGMLTFATSKQAIASGLARRLLRRSVS